MAALAMAATRPHYGGTLRVEMRAKLATLDPTEWPDVAEAAAILKLRELIFDRLVRLDPNGAPQPALALAWEHDAQNRSWQFKLRPAVKWHDGAPLDASGRSRVAGRRGAQRYGTTGGGGRARNQAEPATARPARHPGD